MEPIGDAPAMLDPSSTVLKSKGFLARFPTGKTRVAYAPNTISRFFLARTSAPRYAAAALLLSPFPIVHCAQANGTSD
jgi:hypothetical protein